ncbi:hypothetical protein HOI83_00250 [Candidatus Uhrbacteria bacterium]|jgi:prolyl-tRNA synthetase|nr:hypothetical protein [Candidatus Uhrbacteria bacterium]
MYYSKLFGKTNKSVPHDADSANARLLVQGGFINQLMSGVYTYLPLGLRVLKNVQQIVREEMNAIDGQEILMPALHPKENYIKTDRWEAMDDILFKLTGAGDKELALSSTGEEIVTPLVKQLVTSYKDFPVAVYQIQDKFRNEPRAKSGLLRGREFSMKDLYSFHLTEEDFDAYYDRSKEAYSKIFQRCGLDAKLVEADGGIFSKYSHEYQVFTESGEDLVFHCSCGFAQNKEIAEVKEGDACPNCKDGKISVDKAIEVGNIFPLKTKFTTAFNFKLQGKDGKMTEIIMGCYGIGPSRVMGSIVEVHHDENGIKWPESVAPFKVHIVPVKWADEVQQKLAVEIYGKLEEAGIEVLMDDRDKGPGEKFKDADLLGMPYRVTVGRGAADGVVELRPRATGEIEELSVDDLLKKLV